MFRRTSKNEYRLDAADSAGQIHHVTLSMQGWDGFGLFKDYFKDVFQCGHVRTQAFGYDCRFHPDTVQFPTVAAEPPNFQTEDVTLVITAKKR